MSVEALVWAIVESHSATSLERQGAGRLSTLESAQWTRPFRRECNLQQATGRSWYINALTTLFCYLPISCWCHPSVGHNQNVAGEGACGAWVSPLPGCVAGRVDLGSESKALFIFSVIQVFNICANF